MRKPHILCVACGMLQCTRGQLSTPVTSHLPSSAMSVSASSPTRFRDRRHAGRTLAAACDRLRSYHPLVLALPRGGVPVAFEVARALGTPLDVMVVRKLGAPQHEEFGIGAIGPGGVQVMDEQSVIAVGATPQQIEEIVQKETAEMQRRLSTYRGTETPMDLTDRAVLLVDDGLATGVTAKAAIKAVRKMGAKWVVLAVPVAAPDSLASLRDVADEVIAVITPSQLRAVGHWYDRWDQTVRQCTADQLEPGGVLLIMQLIRSLISSFVSGGC